jgi:hypothetical protein
MQNSNKSPEIKQNLLFFYQIEIAFLKIQIRF